MGSLLSDYLEEHGHEHPLFKNAAMYIENWQRWKSLWDTVEFAEFQHKLIHVGFNVEVEKGEEIAERICFYLEVADGHDDVFMFSKAIGRPAVSGLDNSLRMSFSPIPITYSEITRFIAEEAFDALCGNFFSGGWSGDGVQVARRETFCTNPQILEKLVWFFRVRGQLNIANLYGHFPHLNNSDNVNTAKSFARGLCAFVFRYLPTDGQAEYLSEIHSETREERREVLKGMLPKLIPLILATNQGNLLLKHAEILDDTCIAVLKDLALKEEIYRPMWAHGDGGRKTPRDINEAVYLGSEAAKIYVLLGVVKDEARKRNEVEVLRYQEDQITSRLEELGEPV